MTVSTGYSNYSVYATVEVQHGLILDHVEREFVRGGWSYELVGDRRYRLVIPVYRARFAALARARILLEDFRRRIASLTVDELRLQAPQADPRRIVRISHTEGGWRKLLPARIRTSNDVPIGSAEWEISVERADASPNDQTQQDERSAAIRLARLSQLPGERFDPETMKATTPIGPKRSVRESQRDPAISGPVRALICGGLLGAGALAAIGFISVPAGTSAFAFLGMLVAVYAGTTWYTGNRRSVRVRVGVGLLATALCTALGYAGSIVYTTITSEQGPLLLASLAVAAVVILMSAGWVHLIRTYPSMRRVWGMGVVTVVAAGAGILSQILVGMWGLELGIPGETVAVPVVWRVAAACVVIVAVFAIVLVTGGFIGWMTYVTPLSGSITGRVVDVALAVTLALSFSGIAAQTVVEGSKNVVLGWVDDLREGRTPIFASDFIFRGCLVAPEHGSGSGSGQPFVVVLGSEGNRWRWDLTDDSFGTAQLIPIGEGEIVRVSDYETTC